MFTEKGVAPSVILALTSNIIAVSFRAANLNFNCALSGGVSKANSKGRNDPTSALGVSLA